MNDTLKALIEILREELQSYGEMLAMLDQQQEYVIHRAAHELFQSVGEVQAHAAILQDVRSRRLLNQAECALSIKLPASASFSEIIPNLPEDFRPLIRALVDENNQLLERIHDRVRQHHLLINRSLELMQELLNGLVPTHHVRGYNELGRPHSQIACSPALYQAVG